MAITYERIASTTLSSTVSEVTLSSIPATYTDLHISISMAVSSGSNIGMRVNGDSTTSAYTLRHLTSESNTTPITQFFSANQWYLNLNQANTTESRAQYVVDIFNYTNTSEYKSALAVCADVYSNTATAAANGYATCIQSMVWQNTPAINSITIRNYNGGTTLTTGTIIAIYGILKA